MTPQAALVHHLAGRTRFRIPARRGDRAYFTAVAEQLGQCPGVRSVGVNERTATVLVIHEAEEPDVLTAYARTFELFEAPDHEAERIEQVRAPGAILMDRLRQMDDWVRTRSGHATDLRSVALTGLIAVTVWQVLRGQALPAAGTLLWYALAVARESEPSAAEGDREGAELIAGPEQRDRRPVPGD